MAKTRQPHLNLLRGKSRAEKKNRVLAKPWKIVIGIVLGIALLGAGYAGVLFVGQYAINHHLTDVAGVVDPNSDAYNTLARSLLNIPLEQLHLPGVDSRDDGAKKFAAAQDTCQLQTVRLTYPVNAEKISAAQTAGAAHNIIAKMLFAVRLRDTDPAFVASFDGCITAPNQSAPTTLVLHTDNIFPWANREEWGIAQTGFSRDVKTIDKAADASDIEARMIVATGFVEQMRLYFTEREVYEKFFKPLRVLGNATQFAWGIMSIKEADAIDVENHLNTRTSPYYLGTDKEHLLDFTSDDKTKERMTRLTDEKNHYYSYLYGGLQLAQFMAQWKRANFPINDRPEVLATLYNIGFGKSKPNADPKVGGSTLTIADTQYTFGALAFEFYYSGEMLDVFPYTTTTAQ